MIWYCWKCGQSWEKDPPGYKYNGRFVPFCRDCNQKLHDEASTERAAIREYDGNLSREEAERKVEDAKDS